LADRVVRFAFSPTGREIDRLCVQATGHSPVSWLFARSENTPYNRPLLLTTTGRRSGQPRQVVLPYFDAGAGRICVVGSRGGTEVDPHWALNLRAHPHARVRVARRDHDVDVALVEGADKEPLWKAICERAPIYAKYQLRASRHGREIPVFVLRRRDIPRSSSTP
jgi:deazaflavin-dependent oxidoreductase (nitroreductase family)